jgi:hypothetical protein
VREIEDVDGGFEKDEISSDDEEDDEGGFERDKIESSDDEAGPPVAEAPRRGRDAERRVHEPPKRTVTTWQFGGGQGPLRINTSIRR